jgi:ELWxxDGT repeat protein
VIAGNGVMFFSARDDAGRYGSELWRSDGTAAGTAMVADINPGPAGSQTNSGVGMINGGGMLYFSANDGVSGFELWKIEAGRTVPGTGEPPQPRLVKDIYPGPGGSSPQDFAYAGSTLFFLAYDPDHGGELWKSDGTADGTVMVKDIVPGPGSSFPDSLVAFGERVLFSTYTFDDESVIGLWISDGTEAGTMQIKPEAGDPDIVVAGNRAFLSGWTPDTGFELWVTDGTVAGTHPIDALPGPEGLEPWSWRAALGNNLIFTATNPSVPGHFEPWISDGTVEGTRLLKDIEPGPLGTGPRQHTVVGDLVFFSAWDSAHGDELWVTDGTTEGTRLVKDINRGPASASPGYLRSIRGVLYLRANDELHGFEPWKVTP